MIYGNFTKHDFFPFNSLWSMLIFQEKLSFLLRKMHMLLVIVSRYLLAGNSEKSILYICIIRKVIANLNVCFF